MSHLSVIGVSLAITVGCGSNGHVTEDNFTPRTDVEKEAVERIRYWVDAADGVLDNPSISSEHKARLQAALSATRAALSTYSLVRGRGANRAAVMGPLRLSAGGILADDATGVGVGDNVLLIPLALAAIATYVVTDARASDDELGQAWNEVLDSSRQLGAAVTAATAAMAATEIERRCMERMVHCLENPWQPSWNRDYGPRKACRECYRQCTMGGQWPENICPR